ncbi:MAG TPA: DMT family transporter [Gaiellaceae bacterium]|nr:DMT family transporter [Gaiellaceae bacterium]
MAVAALILVTAVWGVTFVQVQDAVELYPLFAFLAVRYLIATAALAPPAARRVRGLGREGLVAGAVLGVLIAIGVGLQTAGLERTTVTNTGFITGLYVLFTPLLGLALFRTPIPRELWAAVALALLGLALLSGVPEGSGAGDLLVLISTVAQALQIVMVERYANRFDVFALTFVEVAVACVVFGGIAVARGDLSIPHGSTVWAALIVTGLFAVAFAMLVQIWAQRRVSATRIAVIFSLETVFAGIAGYLLADERIGLLGFAGCAAIFAGIVIAEPAAAATLRRLVRRRAPEPEPRPLG